MSELVQILLIVVAANLAVGTLCFLVLRRFGYLR